MASELNGERVTKTATRRPKPDFKSIDQLVRSLPPPERGNKPYGETELRRRGLKGDWLRGLTPRVSAGGGRVWTMRYRADGIERLYTIGDVTAWSAEKVWPVAENLRRRIDEGADPRKERQDRQEAPTIADLAERYLAYAETQKRPRSWAEDKAMIAGVILPALGKIKVAVLEREDVEKLHADVSKRAPVRANRVVSLLRRMLNLATTKFKMREGPNPATSIDRNPESRRTRYLEPAELASLLTAINAHRNQQSANIVRLALLTGARRGELLGATWPQINLVAGIWTKPASLTKQKKLHSIPLNGPAQELLLSMKSAADKENARRAASGLPPQVHLFPGYGANDAQGDLKRSWQSIAKTAGLSDLRFHDLRHSFASFLASSGHNLPLIGQMLGHSSPATTQRYAHLLMDPQREAAERVGAIVSGAGKNEAEVVPLAGRRA